MSVGYFYDQPNDVTQGFIRQANGVIQNLNYPGSDESYPIGINDAGQIVGVFFDANDNGFGYVRNPDGTYRTLSAPGSTTTVPFAIDIRGDVVGYTIDGSLRHGFIATPVPEPGAIALFAGMGVSCVELAARRRRKSRGK